jgi:4-hydroxy-3-methylbut-2-en-1-yl diphosphate reductase
VFLGYDHALARGGPLSYYGAMKRLTILLAAPRGFCAGVDRAVQIVERALALHGPPVYVRHEIVHNAHVVDRLRAMGAVFVAELDEVPDDGQPVVFSAHGVPRAVPRAAAARALPYIDATCPLVSKVHRQVERAHAAGRTVVLIGHAGHPEVAGTMGQAPPGAVLLVEDAADVAALPDGLGPLAYCTQTTLSVDDTAAVVAALTARFPDIQAPRSDDICYATTNRQAAVKALAPRCEAMLVIGAANSSNSNRLVEVARAAGCPDARLVAGVRAVDWAALEGVRVLGITAGASAPEILVEQILDAARARRAVVVEEVAVAREDVHFKLPPEVGG